MAEKTKFSMLCNEVKVYLETVKQQKRKIAVLFGIEVRP